MLTIVIFTLRTICSYQIVFFFFNDPATPEIYTLPLHDALPISRRPASAGGRGPGHGPPPAAAGPGRAEDRKSTRLKLQSQSNLVCRLLLEKKKDTSPLYRAPLQGLGQESTTAGHHRLDRVYALC